MFFNGKTHYFDWAMFNSYVELPEGVRITGKIGNIHRRIVNKGIRGTYRGEKLREFHYKSTIANLPFGTCGLGT